MARVLDRMSTGPSLPAYRALAEQLRRDIREQRYAEGQRLPTEAELSDGLGLSRQTVRRAFQDLVAEGTVYRVPGRGTFVRPDAGKYLRPSGSIEDLMTIVEDTELEVLRPPALGVDIEAAGRLRLDTDEVVSITFRRFHDDQPFCVTTAYLPPPIGEGLFAVPGLQQIGVRQRATVLSVVQGLAGSPIAGADQSITAVGAPAALNSDIDVAAGEPVLRIDRLYFDTDRRLVELAVNYFNPARYSYRFRMKR
ncbi:MAG: GntR family transcriptional regulator [Acidimicrobiales bacterium]